MAATPNRMGRKGDTDAHSARRKTIAFKNDDRKPSPIPLEECPWCGEKFKSTSFQLLPNPDEPTDLRVTCANRRCDFSRGNSLPILSVDEPVYRRQPCFMIATVDKFAALPWTGEVGGFFGRVDRVDSEGFYGPCHPTAGRPLPVDRLHPPDLVIQDELHLISGPLGTMVGLYETALDELAAVDIGGKRVHPKVIASTATVRRAQSLESLIAALRSGRITAPYSALQISRVVPSTAWSGIVRETLTQLAGQGFSPEQIATVVELIQRDRRGGHAADLPIDLVTSGPEAPGITNRDTSVVVRELFAHATQSVLVVGYAVYQGQQVFRSLAKRMEEVPGSGRPVLSERRQTRRGQDRCGYPDRSLQAAVQGFSMAAGDAACRRSITIPAPLPTTSRSVRPYMPSAWSWTRSMSSSRLPTSRRPVRRATSRSD